MKRVPYSYSTFPSTQVKADTKAKREGTTVSTKIHNFLLEYTKDELDPTEQPPVPASPTNTAVAAPGNQPENTPTAVPEAIQPENTSNGGESLQPPLAPETEVIELDTEPVTQPENNIDAELIEPVHSEINTDRHEPLAEGKPVPPVKKKSPAGKPAKKAGSATVKKTPPQKALKKVTPKPGVSTKKKNQAGKSKKSKAKS
jgi:hypothetical protein